MTSYFIKEYDGQQNQKPYAGRASPSKQDNHYLLGILCNRVDSHVMYQSKSHV